MQNVAAWERYIDGWECQDWTRFYWYVVRLSAHCRPWDHLSNQGADVANVTAMALLHAPSDTMRFDLCAKAAESNLSRWKFGHLEWFDFTESFCQGPGSGSSDFETLLKVLVFQKCWGFWLDFDFVNLPLTVNDPAMTVRLLSVLMPDRLLSYHGSRAERAEQWWFRWDEDTQIRRCHSCHWWFRHRFWGAKACIVRLLALKQFACAIFCAKSRAISVLHRELIWKPIDQWAFQQKRLKCFVLRRGKDFRSRMWQLMTSGYKMIQVSKTNTNDNTWNSWHLLVRLAVTWVFGYFQMSSSLQPTFLCQVRFVPQSSRLMAALYWQASSAQKGSKNHLKTLKSKYSG